MIEFERVQIIRKRARTHLINCSGCRDDADFILLPEAAALFGTPVPVLFRFIREAGSHYLPEENGGFLICLNSLLAAMRDHGHALPPVQPSRLTEK